MVRLGYSVACACMLGVVFVSALAAQDTADQSKAASAASAKFVNFPGLPTCLKGAVQNGDPASGPAVILAKAQTGCVVPWHWHTASEQLMIVSGSGTMEMKDHAPQKLAQAAYVNLPSKHQHQFHCTANCTFFISTGGAFDIHYVDKSGNEIPPEQALKARAGKRAEKPEAGAKKGK